MAVGFVCCALAMFASGAGLAQAATFLTMAEAKRLVRKGAERYIETFNAEGYRIRSCGRQSRTKITCMRKTRRFTQSQLLESYCTG